MGSGGILRLATNLLDVPAEIISLLFSRRWAIEIFFRFFKHILGCRHLLSHDQNGIEIQRLPQPAAPRARNPLRLAP